MIYKTFDVVVVPFPFTDKLKSKNRPALVLSSSREFGNESGHMVLAMITSAKNSRWPLDISLSQLREAGLSQPCVVRMKLFTLDHRLIKTKIGSLSGDDKKNVSEALSLLFLNAFNI